MAQEKDYFFQVQGLKSFCKAKGDWLDFDKVHLSFVQHSGKPKCEQISAIEGAVKLHGSDGALYLSDIVLSGRAERMAAKSLEEAKANNSSFAKAIFTSMGGTVAARSKTGKAVFRQFSVAPGSKSDFVFSMMMCDGEENQTGGIQPVKNAQKTTIYVPLSRGDLFDFARSVQSEYVAYRTGQLLKSSGSAEQVSPPDNSEPAEPAKETAPAPKDDFFVIIYDTVGIINSGLPFVVCWDAAEKHIQDITRKLLQTEQKYVAVAKSYTDCIEKCKTKKPDSAVIQYKSKVNSNDTCALVVTIAKALS